jgi:transcriptional regulator GlxA family with amidase domain
VNDDGKTIAFVLSAGLTPLDFIGPPQVMSGLEVVEATFGMQPRRHVVVVAEDLDPVPTDTPVQVAATTTLSTGSLLLAGAGLPHGRPATTHWVYHRFLERLGGDLRAPALGRDARYLTGAGISAGIDTALRLAAILTSDDVAHRPTRYRVRPTAARTAESTGATSTGTTSDSASRDSPTRRWTTTRSACPARRIRTQS